MTEADGSVYAGEYDDDARCAQGVGVYVSASGNTYAGEWSRGRRSGHGVVALCSSPGEGQNNDSSPTYEVRRGGRAIAVGERRGCSRLLRRLADLLPPLSQLLAAPGRALAPFWLERNSPSHIAYRRRGQLGTPTLK